MTIVTVSQEHTHLRAWLESMPRLFDEQQGKLLYSGRNEVRLFRIDGRQLVAKRFHRHNWLKRLVYTFLRTNKARRAYENARQLRQRGFSTPREVACIEERSGGTLRQVFYVCEFTDAQPIRPLLIDQAPFDKELATAYARFVARLHETGILHRDLNPTNVLHRPQPDGSYDFQLIDINRMRFYDGPVPRRECMENLTLFWWLTDVYRFVLREYARQRGWTQADVEEAIRVKQRHDKAWVRRKRITHPFRK